MIINHNMSAMAASRMSNINTGNIDGSIAKLSSGERINRASDDAAGLSISEKMRSQIRGLNQASKNVADGVGLIQTASGYLSETTDILQRIRELAVQSSNGVYQSEERQMIQIEVSQLISEIDRISSTAQFNGINLLSGRFAEDAISFHIGANMDQNVQVNIGSMSASALGLTDQDGEMITIASSEQANMVIGTIDEALKTVNKQRADLGAYQNRFEMAQKGIDISAENLQAAESRIRDTNMAEEIVSYTKNQLLQQAATSMISQANSQSENVLKLLH